MFKLVISRFWFLLLACLISFPAIGQTIKERSDKAYAGLLHSIGPSKVKFLNELTLYRVNDSVERATILAKQAISEAEKINNQPLLAKSLVILGSVYIAKNKPDSAEYYLSQAGNLFRIYAIADNFDFYYYTLAKLKYERKSYKEAESILNKAIPLSEQDKDFMMLGRIYLSLAKCNKQLGQKQDLITNLAKSEHNFNKGNDPVVIGPHLIGLGILYADLGLYDKANTQFIKAARMCELTSDSLFIGYMYTNLSFIYDQHGFPKKADEYFGKSMRIFRALKNDKAIAYNLNLLGMGYLSEKEYKKAVPVFTESAALKEKIKEWQGACFAYGNLAEAYVQLKNTAKAEEAIKSAEMMCAKAGDKLSQAAFLLSKGKYHTYLKEYNTALDCYNKSLSTARVIAVQGIVEENLLAISEMYQAKGDAAEALRYYKIYTTGKDSVMRAASSQTMSETLAKYETDKKDSQIQALITSNLKSEKRKYYIIGNVIAVILLLFVAIVFFFRLKGNYADRLQFMLTIREHVSHQREKAIELFMPVLPDRASKPLLTQEMQKGIWLQLEYLMENEKLFLDKDLSMAELARKLNTNTTYLSRVINEITHQNFSNYLNQYRIDEACRLLSGPQGRNLTIEGIAQTVGFNSKSAFNTAFKKIKTITPSEFLIAQSDEIEQLACTNL